MSGRVVAVCTSERTGQPKRQVPSAVLRVGHGLEGDAHAGDWHRQVSLLDVGDIREMEAKGLRLRPGAFGENLVVADLDTAGLGIGSRLHLGSAELRITQVGKVCHSRCAIYHRTGDCIMPRLGLFAAVTAGGSVAAGTPVEVVRRVPRGLRQLAVVATADGEPAAERLLSELEAADGLHAAVLRVVAPDDLTDAVEDLRGRGVAGVAVVTGQAWAGARPAADGRAPVVVVPPHLAAVAEVLGRLDAASPAGLEVLQAAGGRAGVAG